MAHFLLTTVWHTGSNYMRKQLSQEAHVLFQHCDPEFWKKFPKLKHYRLITTLRDPYLVGASWANRYDMNSAEYQWHWHLLWAGWERLLDYEPEIFPVHEFTGAVEKSVGDPNGAHELLAQEDWDNYFKLIPEHLVNFANRIVDKL